jgi:glycogen operon protein
VVDASFDWGFDQPLNRDFADAIIYELHVRTFTCGPGSGVAYPGTYLGLIEKIPYLQQLGVNTVELMPIFEFDETDNPRVDPNTGQPLRNVWGYHPLSFFAPKASFAHAHERAGAEVKTLVKALHEAGIEVILDVVFNHTAEGDHRGQTLSYRGLDNSTYYIVDPATGAYHNYSGCGNSLNCNHPVVRDLVLDALRYWVVEFHIDGFRFDLASILGRGRDGQVLSNPPLLERIAADPVLSATKLIAEAWDAAGLYQVGSFPHHGRWAEWNGKYRDDVRRAVRGDAGQLASLATRLSGSSDLYQTQDRAPSHGVNFVTCHDGFTMADLVAYSQKHNHANGENNDDGCNDNHSFNCGAEGPSGAPEVALLRQRQVKNFFTLLLASQGVPMISSGDEVGRTQNGNNNAYCQDTTVGWFDWALVEKNQNLFAFVRGLIDLRKRYSALRRRAFDDGGGAWVRWSGLTPGQPDWSPESRALAMHLLGQGGEPDLLVLVNTGSTSADFELPPQEGRWLRCVDTALASPDDLIERGVELLTAGRYTVAAHATAILIGAGPVAARPEVERHELFSGG